MQDLEQAFADRGLKRGSCLLFHSAEAVDFIEAARQRQQPVLGIDSFIITETTTEPLMEHILDLSVSGLPDDTWSEARRFVEERRDSGFMFEICI
jgi:hypothetical protein